MKQRNALTPALSPRRGRICDPHFGSAVLSGLFSSTAHLEAMRRAWRKPDRRRIYDWAGREIFIPPGVYTVSGWFDVSASRYLIKPFDALQSDVVRKVTCQWPTRSGKSLLADVWLMWLIYQSSGPTMWNFNTDPQARKHFRTRLLPLMRATRCIAELLPADMRKLTQEVIFRDGKPLYVQGPALDNLQGVGICNLIEDELWRRETGRHAQALSRLGDYQKLGIDKNLNIGQGGHEGDDQDLEFEAGTKEEWMAPCLYCGHVQETLFTGNRADGSMFGMRFGDKPECKDRHGDWIISKVVPTIRWECEKCGQVHADETRTKKNWNDVGDYFVQNADAARVNGDGPLGTAVPTSEYIERSFHIDALMTKGWVDQVIGHCLAMNQVRVGNMEPLIALTQKDRARTWSETRWLNAKPVPTFDSSKSWDEEAFRFILTDVQELGLKYLLVMAVSRRGELRPLWFGKIFGEAEILKQATEFKVKPNNVFLDAGHDAKGSNGVYAMCIRNGWFALRGDDRASWTHNVIIKTPKGPVRTSVERSYSAICRGDPESGRIGQGVQYARLIYWSNPTIKNRFARLRDRGKFVLPAKKEGEPELAWVTLLKKHLSGSWKIRIRNQVTGRWREVWKDNGEDHGADCVYMGTLAATLAKCLVDDPVAELHSSGEIAPATETVEV